MTCEWRVIPLNPEIEFREKYKPDYTGMALTELPFCEIENHTGAQQTYKLDLITSPKKPGKPRPVVFFVHGGGFIQPCDKRQAYISVFARTLTAAGYAVVSPDYPLFADGAQLAAAGGEPAGYAKAGEAVHQAYRYIAEHAKELELNPERIAIMGGSAGGWASFYGIADHPEDRYRAFINLWGAPDRLPDLAGFPPTLSVHGNADLLVPYERELPIQEQLKAHGIRHSLITLDSSGHTPLDRMDDYLPQVMALLDSALV